MGRAKIVMERINDHKKRKITFKTRKQGLIKKARELSTLCDVNVSMIICSDDQENPQIVPPDCQKLNNLIDVYKHNRCVDPGRINFYFVSDYLMERKIGIEEKLAKEKKKTLEAKYPPWSDFMDVLSEAKLRELALWLEHKIVYVGSRIESVKMISNFQNLDRDLYYPVPIEDNLIVQSSNPNLVNQIMGPIMMPSSYPDSLLNMMLDEDDDGVYDGEYFRLQPPLMEHWFPPELM